MTVVETKGFLNLVSAPAVTLNYPFSLLFSAWRVLEPFRLECVRIPLVRVGKNGRIIMFVKFGIVRHRLSLLAQQVPVVQAGVRIVNQNARKKQNPPKRVKCGCVEDA